MCIKSLYWNWLHWGYKCKWSIVLLVLKRRCIKELPICVYFRLTMSMSGILLSISGHRGMIRLLAFVCSMTDLLVFIFFLGTFDRVAKVLQGVEDICLLLPHGSNNLCNVHRIRRLNLLAAIR